MKQELDRSERRSSKYQWLIVEQPVSNDVMAQWTSEVGIPDILNQNSPEKQEELEQLKDKLYLRLWQVIEETCTSIQQEVITLYYKEGWTQAEIAKKRGVNQSSCIKTLIGNATYTGAKKNYGGALPKLGKKLSKDKEFQKLLTKIKEFQS